MTTLRWLHLSDFHTGKDGYGQNRLFQYILEHVISRVQSGLAPDFVFITGDIANKGQVSEYQEFNENFLLPLVGLLPPETQSRVFLIPGNHDVDRNQTRAVQTYDILVKIPDFLDPTEKGKFERDQAVFPRFRAYAENDMISTGEHWLFSLEGVHSNTFSFGENAIGVLSVNTAWFSCSDYDRHKLSAGKPLLEDELEKIKECDFKFVLGHHPLDWFLDEELEPVRALLGRHNVIYLHGHMHKNRSRYEEGAGFPFLALQSGACFQAREDDLWINRFLWSEMDLETREVSIEPLQWSRDNQEWVLDSSAFPEKYRQHDRWIISLPSPSPVADRSNSSKGKSQKIRDLPKGWVVIDDKYLKSLTSELTAEQALSFFDGRAPIWREALAPQIPRREIVNNLVQHMETAQISGGIQVTLLLGAAGEGKTTALLQSVCGLVNSNNELHVLWHEDSSSPLPVKFIAQLPRGGTWLIVSDDAEIIARRVFEAAQLLTDRRDIQFFLCSRDTDWRGVGADKFNWKSHHVQFTQFLLRGLSTNDAEQVVLAWSRYGKEGLRELNNLKLNDASLQLAEAAKSLQTDSNEGTFFGAILEIRYGSELKSHISSLIDKLTERSITSSTTLGDAFAYISAMHAENLPFLSKEVLAEVLSVKLNDLKRSVLAPLGEEAAIATTGSYIFTRHHSIAKTALQILSDEHGSDIENLYFDLVQAAMIRGQNEFIPSYSNWVYLCSYFFNKGNQGLGIRLAKLVLEITPEDTFSIVKLAQLYREAHQPEQSVKLFRSLTSSISNPHRSFYSEWGTAEGNIGNHAIGVWLTALSLSDEVSTRRLLDNDTAKISLAGAALAFAELFDKFNERIFIEACHAAAKLGLRLRVDPKAKNWLVQNLNRAKAAGVEDVSPQLSLARLRSGFISAWERREIDLPDWLASHALNFQGLTRLLQI